MRDCETTLLVQGLHFAEAPRWHDGRLWLSDIFGRRVLTVEESGEVATVAELPDALPCGLGFLPDGTPLVVNMQRPEILALGPSGPRVHADVSHLAVGGLNDMVVDDRGRAYVGSMGTHGALVPRPVAADGVVILVEPDGSARVVADEMDAPNGPCLLPDGGYVVAEFPASRLVGFTRAPDGSLADRTVWADLHPASADGIAADGAGAIWTASPRDHECRRVLRGGEVSDRIPVGDAMPLACALGGSDGHTLFILAALGGEEAIKERTCRSVVLTARVAVGAHAGAPR
ncbi:SMP-30/gluconolactonase/LRE family protein [Nocardioides sp. QY071]|uniref:SMP-30/gluconolactonase/LRE family protein n=1 Tax=Nocardioides sp. QY071 TaxID=3044187 RepID=UPI00249B8F51|nr:SMP-30/gluconolactonase/LRE family protein [Nocardioides sp. QY071]WGY00365.1 SMP-30/gluconolactonase/LRE family protein [Nocardioides sp. QY071]